MGGAVGVQSKVQKDIEAVNIDDLTAFCKELDKGDIAKLQAALQASPNAPKDAPATAATATAAAPPPATIDKAAQEKLWSACINGDETGIREAISDGAVPDAVSEEKFKGAPAGLTAMMFAARAGMHDCLKVLQESGASLNSKDKDGWTPVHFAARNLRKKCIETLWDLGADFGALTTYKRNVVDILEEQQADMEEDDGGSELKLLTEILAFVKDKGVNRSPQGEMFSAARSGDVAQLKAALAAGAHVNVPNVNSRSALSFAAEKGNPACMTILIEHQADLDAVDGDQWTAVHYAAAAGEPECLEKLVELGASLGPITKFKRNCLDLVSEDLIDNPPESKDDPRKRCVTFLRENGLRTTPHSDLFRSAKVGDVAALEDAAQRGADINLTNASSFTAFMCAADMGNIDCLKELKGLGAQLEMSDRDGWTAVHFAAYNGQGAVLKLLAELGSDLQAITMYKRNAVDLAEDRLTCDLSTEEEDAYKEIVRYLRAKRVKPSPQGNLMKHAKVGNIEGCKEALAAGAEVNFKDFEGNTAADWASRNNKKECLKFLVENGAVWEG